MPGEQEDISGLSPPVRVVFTDIDTGGRVRFLEEEPMDPSFLI